MKKDLKVVVRFDNTDYTESERNLLIGQFLLYLCELEEKYGE